MSIAWGLRIKQTWFLKIRLKVTGNIQSDKGLHVIRELASNWTYLEWNISPRCEWQLMVGARELEECGRNGDEWLFFAWVDCKEDGSKELSISYVYPYILFRGILALTEFWIKWHRRLMYSNATSGEWRVVAIEFFPHCPNHLLHIYKVFR